MGMTMSQKILAAHAGLESVKAGQLINAELDMVLGNDITSPVAVKEFEKAGFPCVKCPSRVSMVMDHFTPNKDIKAAEQVKTVRTFANKYGVENFFDVGEMGIEHALCCPKKGWSARATSSSARTATPAPTARSARSRRAWAPRTWRRA